MSQDSATKPIVFLPVSSSEEASLHGQKAKTPIIAGSVCGGVMFLAWVIGFSIYFRKRYRRKQRKRLAAEGKPVPELKTKNPRPEEKIIIPPDPAVLSGMRQPGERVYPEHRPSHTSHAHSSTSDPTPVAQGQIADTATPNTTA